MKAVPLIIALLIIAAVATQIAAFFVTLRIRRNSVYKVRLDKSEPPPKTQVQEPVNE